MSKYLVYLVSFVLVLSLVCDVQAGGNWIGGADNLWSTPGNWEGGELPIDTDNVAIMDLPGPTVMNEVGIARFIRIFDGALTIDGGTVGTKEWVVIAQNEGTTGTLYMNSGTINCGWNFVVGEWGTGTLEMTGGTINVPKGDGFIVARTRTSVGHAKLYGGTVNAVDILMRGTAGGDGAIGTMDVRAGTLIINGNRVSKVQGYIDNGWITPYSGNGTLLLDYDATNKGKTTLKAISALNPIPADGGLASPGEVELSWTLPDPCVPGEPVPVDVYFTDDRSKLVEFTDPGAIRVVNNKNVTSVVVQTQLKTQYYWAVDTYIGSDNDPVLGPIFSFFADNLTPDTDAGKNVVTWLLDGVKTYNLDATVTDDGFVNPYTVQWTVVSEPDDPNSPDAVIADTSAEDTSITMSALGEYVLQLEAFDGEYAGSDTLTINVYSDSCQAAQSLPDYEPFPGDVNGDCIFNQDDLDILNEDWLKDNSLTEDMLID